MRELGRGGFGVVFLAEDPQVSRRVALKVPRLDVLASPELRARFLLEGKAAGGLDHPNIVPVYEAGEVDGVCYLVMPYCEGPTLAAWMAARSAPVSPRAAAALTATLADAVEHAHQRGVLHRDLKPANVLLHQAAGASPDPGGPAGAPRIVDFGLAKLLEAGDDTLSGLGAGTPAYMAPEQVSGPGRRVGPPADVWALGVILYELLAGRQPFRADRREAQLRQVLEHEPLPPRRRRRDVPPDLETVCLKCLDKEPGRRYATARELADDLRRFLDGKPVRAQPVGLTGRALRWARRRPTAATALAAAGLALLGLLGALTWSAARARDDARAVEAARDAERRQAEEAAHERARRLAERRAGYARDLREAARLWDERQDEALARLLDAQRPADGEEDLRGFEWRLFQKRRRSRPAGRPLGSPNGPIRALALSPDGQTLASGGKDAVVRLWDLGADGGLKRELRGGHRSTITALGFAADGQTLLSAGGWDPTAGELNGWDLASGQRTPFAGVGGPVNDLVLVPGTDRFVVTTTAAPSSAAPAAVQLWDLHRRRAVLAEGPGGFNGAAVAPDGKSVVVLVSGAGPRVLPLDGKGRAADLSAAPFDGWNLALSPDGKTLAAAGLDSTLRLWDLPGGPERAVLRHPDRVFGVAFAPDGRTLASGCRDGKVRIWDTASGELQVEQTFPGPVYRLQYTADGRSLAVGCDAAQGLWLWPAPQPKAERLMTGHVAGVWSLAYSPDGRTLASAGDDLVIRLWDREGRLQRLLWGHWSTVAAVAFSPDGQTLASTGLDRTVRLWDVASGQLRRSWTIDDRRGGRCLAFAPDGRTLAVGGYDGQVLLWDVGTGAETARLDGHGMRAVRALAFAPDGRTLASAAQDGCIHIWEIAGPGRPASAPARTLAGADEVWSLAFTPDGQALAAGDGAGEVRLWEAATGRLLWARAMHGGGVRALAFAPDGRTLASGGHDRAVMLWHTATGERLATLAGHTNQVYSAAFAPDGRTLAAGDRDGAIRLWEGAE
jgi:WD40 repeat protein